LLFKNSAKRNGFNQAGRFHLDFLKLKSYEIKSIQD